LVVVLARGAFAGEHDWPRFRGPNGTGVSPASTIPARWTDQDYNWKVEVPGVGHSSPVAWGDCIFLTSADRETARRTVLCLDTADGRTRWRHDYPSHTFRQHRHNSYATATPAVDGHGVVVTWSTFDEMALMALDREGRETWRRDLGPYVGKHGTGASPILVGGLVVLANDQENPGLLPQVYGESGSKIPAGKSFLIAVDRKTGRTRWHTERRTGLSARLARPLHRNCQNVLRKCLG
jgi:outer membrane protein assembly factor BamB